MSATILEIRHVHVLLTGSAHDDESVLPNSVPRIRITEPKMLPDSRWNGRWIQASPYEEDSHLTDLGPLDVQSQLFALALMSLRSADNNYQSVFYEQALNWSEVKAQLQKLTRDIGINWQRQDFYVVEFRSTLKEGIDLPLLFRLDKESHREAAESGGLLKYWYGMPDCNRRNLATCLWRNQQNAIDGGKGPSHRQARGIIPHMYESIDVRGFHLIISDRVEEWTFLKK